MFKFKSAYDEVTNDLEKMLSKQASSNENNKLLQALTSLDTIALKLDKLGFEKEAEVITKLLETYANDEYLEGVDEYKREALEDEYLDEVLDNPDYDELLKELMADEEEDLSIDETDL